MTNMTSLTTNTAKHLVIVSPIAMTNTLPRRIKLTLVTRNYSKIYSLEKLGGNGELWDDANIKIGIEKLVSFFEWENIEIVGTTYTDDKNYVMFTVGNSIDRKSVV